MSHKMRIDLHAGEFLDGLLDLRQMLVLADSIRQAFAIDFSEELILGVGEGLEVGVYSRGWSQPRWTPPRRVHVSARSARASCASLLGSWASPRCTCSATATRACRPTPTRTVSSAPTLPQRPSGTRVGIQAATLGSWNSRVLVSVVNGPGESMEADISGAGPPQPAYLEKNAIKVTVTLPSRQSVTGALVRLTDFDVTLYDPAAGSTRTWTRNGDVPKVDVVDPLQAHIDMWTKWTDADMHNMTAYLASLK